MGEIRGAVERALAVGANSRRLLVRLAGDEAGSIAVFVTLLMSIMIGIAGLGTEAGLWFYSHQILQSAADSAALSAARYYNANNGSCGTGNAGCTTQAEAITAQYNLVNGTNGVTVTVNNPPKSGIHTADSNAIEVIVTQGYARLLSALWNTQPVNISGRAVALGNPPNCVLALGSKNAAGAVAVDLLAAVTLTGCGLFSDSNNSASIQAFLGFIDATGGTVGTAGNVAEFLGFISPTPTTNDPIVKDPYAQIAMPSAGTCVTGTAVGKPFKVTTSTTLSAGTYCGGMLLCGGSISKLSCNPGTAITVTLNPGIYIFNAGSPAGGGNSAVPGLMLNNAKLNGTGGVTLVFTGSGTNYATLSAQNGSPINLVAPTTGSTAGMVMFGDRNMPVDNPYTFDAVSGLTANGVVYLPEGAITFYALAGSADNCTQIIADQIQFFAIAGLAVSGCGNVVGSLPISNVPTLVE